MIIDKFGRMFFPVQDIETMDLADCHLVKGAVTEEDVRQTLHKCCEPDDGRVYLEKGAHPSKRDRTVLLTTSAIRNSNFAVTKLIDLAATLENQPSTLSAPTMLDPLINGIPQSWTATQRLEFTGTEPAIKIAGAIDLALRKMSQDMVRHLLSNGFETVKLLVGTDPLIAQYLELAGLLFKENEIEINSSQHVEMQGRIYLSAEIKPRSGSGNITRLGKFYVGERQFNRVPDINDKSILIRRFNSRFVLSNMVLGRIRITGMPSIC